MLWNESQSVITPLLEPLANSKTDFLKLSHPQTIAFVDPTVDDATALASDLQVDAKFILDPNRDGIDQITEVLSRYQGVTGIDIIAHGNTAELQLGNASFSASSLQNYAQELQQWKPSLATGADILFYACNVAAGEVGKAFVKNISTLTGADIAASTDLTGDSSQGGNWDLEYTTGQIETAQPFTSSFISSYHGILPSLFTTQTPTLTNLTDGTGSVGDYELGMEFRSAKVGQISAVRYFKAASETGVHVGKIWSSTGTLLASVTFANETASGWQEQALATPLTIAANTTYVTSVNANTYYVATSNGIGSTITNGDLSAVADGSNGVFNFTPGLFPTQSYNNTNYFRDVVFTPNTPGSIAITGTPTQNQILTANVTDPDGLTGVTINYQWQQSSNNGTTWTNIAGAINNTLTLTPAQVGSLVRSTATYTDALGGSENLSSTALAVVAANQSVFASTATPTLTNVTDGVGSAGDYELGMEFQSAKAGKISAIRYYKAASETGAHVGNIWSNTGTLLASVTFTNETGSGWQEQALASPLNIAANTTYVVSVNDNTYYVATSNGITTTITNGDLSAVADGSNGVFNFTPGLFPTQSYNNTNYFRDIVFTPNTGANNPGLIAITGTPTQNQVLTANVTDVDGTTGVTINYQWQQSSNNGTTWTNIAGATNKTLTLVQAQVGNLVRSTATYSDALGNSENVVSTATTAVANVNDLGTAILAGSATIGQSLKANILDQDGLTGVNINYQWQQLVSNVWTNITGATTASLTLTNALLGQLVRVSANYIDALGSSENISSSGANIAAQNAIVIENQKAGTADWRITNLASNNEILGFGDATSINKGQTLNLKVSLAQAGQYRIDVYRLGYYGGAGARLVNSVAGLNGTTQVGPTINPITKLVEYNWNTSYALQTGTDWTTGLYEVKLTDTLTGKQTYVPFVLRDDNRPADLGFQDAVSTAQAYNNFGGTSVYDFNSTGGRAYQVSFDRPYGAAYLGVTNTDGFNNNSMLSWEYNMTRWLESQGYDVSYFTDVDVDANPFQLYSQKTYLSVGHDEYWSMNMRNNIEQARDNGINLAFFSANTGYWQVRLDPSSSGEAGRVMTVYKDSSGVGSNPSLDPIAQSNPAAATTLFRSPQVNRPENALLGVGYIGDTDQIYGGYDFVVSNAADPYYANTGLKNGDRLTGLVGYEWDGLLNNGKAPAGLVVLSQSPVPSSGLGPLGLLPPGTNDTISNSVRYTAASGAKVFSTGTVQWAWGLDSDGIQNPRVDPRVQQITVNILADMGAKPLTPSAGIVVPFTTPTKQSVFTAATVPTLTNLTDGVGSAGDYELGMEFRSTKAGLIDSIRYFRAANETGTHIGKIWSSTGTLLASVIFTDDTGSGWKEQALASPLSIAANTTYIVSVNANTYYVATSNGIGSTITNGDLSAVADGSNGVFNFTPGLFPLQSFNNTNYFRDVVFTPI